MLWSQNVAKNIVPLENVSFEITLAIITLGRQTDNIETVGNNFKHKKYKCFEFRENIRLVVLWKTVYN